jgi:glyoxylase-like metal-dependent hydrolase (beta-lactamase superfamily II)
VQLAAASGKVAAVVFTHGHWDHVMGWRSFPEAEVLTSPSLHAAMAQELPPARRNLQDAADFDRRWYIERGAPPQWPPLLRTRAVSEGEELKLGAQRLVALHLPGHSADGLALWAPPQGLLLVGDYLSPLEIPFVEDLMAYRQTLRRLLALLDQVEQVLPGHGPPLPRAKARAIAAADLAYLDALADCAARGDAPAALALSLPRCAQVKEMLEHHRDNCRVAGLHF